MRTAVHSSKVALVVALVVGSAAACGDSSGPNAANTSSTTQDQGAHPTSKSTTAAAPKGETASIKVLEKAIAETQLLTTGHFNFGGEVESESGSGSAAESEPETTVVDDFMDRYGTPGAPGKGSTNGVFDRVHKRARVDLGKLAEQLLGIASIVVDGDDAYVGAVVPTDVAPRWWESSLEKMRSDTRLVLGGVNPADPMDLLQDVKFVGATATVVGSGQLDGSPVVQYEARMNLNALDDAQPSQDSTVTIVKRESPAADDVPVNLWIDEKGRVLRFWYAASYDVTTTFRMTRQPDMAPQTSTGHTSVMFDLSVSKLGEPVSIDVPSRDQVAPPMTSGDRHSG